MHADDDARFTIRRFQRGDEARILKLFARSFGTERSIEHWRWKYEDDPYGAERISVAFDGNGELVAHYAGYPVAFRIDGRDAIGNQIGDTMTDPSIRHIGRGPTSLLGRTALHFYENFCENRVAFNFGFNVSNIQKFSLKFLRSTRVENVFYRLRDLRQNPLRPLSRLERYARGVGLDLVDDTSPEWDSFWTRVEKQYAFLVRRDAQYVRWRYLLRPDVRYTVVAIRKWRTLAGWLVLRLRNGRLAIVDMLLDADLAETFETALRHLAPIYATSVIEMWCPPRPRWLHELLLSLRFESQPEPQDLSVMCVPFLDGTAPFRMADSLYYTMGDSDLF